MSCHTLMCLMPLKNICTVLQPATHCTAMSSKGAISHMPSNNQTTTPASHPSPPTRLYHGQHPAIRLAAQPAACSCSGAQLGRSDYINSWQGNSQHPTDHCQLSSARCASQHVHYTAQQMRHLDWQNVNSPPQRQMFQISGCSKGSAPYWSNPPFLIFDIQALWRSVLSARPPECQKLKMVG